MRVKQLPPRAYSSNDSKDYSESSYSSRANSVLNWGSYVNDQLRPSIPSDLKKSSQVLDVPNWSALILQLRYNAERQTFIDQVQNSESTRYFI